MSCSSSNVTQWATLEMMPVEIKVLIMGHITNFRSFRNLLVSSKIYNETFKCNETHVARELMVNLIGPALYKLAFMAEVSGHIDAGDSKAVEQFINRYVCHEEWPLSVYNMQRAAAVRASNEALYKATSAIRCEGFRIWHLGSECLSPTERIRLHRMLYICQIAGNLFRWSSSSLEVLYFETSSEELSHLFWSRVPEWDAARLKMLVSSSEPWLAMATGNPTPLGQSIVLSLIMSAQCPKCRREAADPSTMRAGVYLGSGLSTWCGTDSHRLRLLIENIRRMYADSCAGGAHDFDHAVATKVFHHTGKATLRQPLPLTSPFYEQDSGIQECFYKMKSPFASLRRSLEEFLRLRRMGPGFLLNNMWVMAIMDKTRLPDDPSNEALDVARER
ncbi:hypothetical protein F4803DRAFT_568903 [Xylaria telfairii]|nr:hypothetical protein F4803DRAFT_568903 [Xylaria telfairii]